MSGLRHFGSLDQHGTAMTDTTDKQRQSEPMSIGPIEASANPGSANDGIAERLRLLAILYGLARTNGASNVLDYALADRALTSDDALIEALRAVHDDVFGDRFAADDALAVIRTYGKPTAFLRAKAKVLLAELRRVRPHGRVSVA